MTRRRFTFWLGFGLFTLAEKLHSNGLDALAAAAMGGGEQVASAQKSAAIPEHWTHAEDETWQWFERENYLDGQWVLTGSTTPTHKQTGERKAANEAYLEDSFLPPELRPAEATDSPPRDRENAGNNADAIEPSLAEPADADESLPSRQLPATNRRARHGRPPSKWLRSLNADEIRIWLKTVEVPEAGVSGMTYWEHLTRDHSFGPAKIEGLTEAEQAKLHAAAHYGY
jgi:hypothetical protein